MKGIDIPYSLLKEDTTSTQIQIKLNKVGFDKLSLEEERKRYFEANYNMK